MDVMEQAQRLIAQWREQAAKHDASAHFRDEPYDDIAHMHRLEAKRLRACADDLAALLSALPTAGTERPPAGWTGLHEQVWNRLQDAGMTLPEADTIVQAIADLLPTAGWQDISHVDTSQVVLGGAWFATLGWVWGKARYNQTRGRWVIEANGVTATHVLSLPPAPALPTAPPETPAETPSGTEGR